MKRHFLPQKKEIVKSIFTKEIFKDKKYIIGNYTYGKPTVLFENSEANLLIGKFCSIAQGVTIFLGGNHNVDWLTTYPFNVLDSDFSNGKKIKGHPTTKGDVVIGNDVWIGRNVTIMSGVKIENGAVIGAGAVVTKNIGAYEVWAGNPAKFIKKRFNQNTIDYLNNLNWWNWNTQKINNNLVDLCSANIESLKNNLKY
ncbi:chloramphenicol acetyltransferase [Gaetbulibacter sp. 5U11]|nr:chloramphenicol acetyltransferase [Gaetbulibacter sp. 5U11]